MSASSATFAIKVLIPEIAEIPDSSISVTTDVAVIPPLCTNGLIATLIKETPTSLSLKISNLLVVITFGAVVYPEPPSIKSTLITCPLLTNTSALAPPPLPSKVSNLSTGGV